MAEQLPGTRINDPRLSLDPKVAALQKKLVGNSVSLPFIAPPATF